MKDYLDKFSLKGKTAYIAGGAGLLGAETSYALASAGAKVIILDINKEKGERIANQIKERGAQAHYEYFDTGDLDSIEPQIDKLTVRYNPLDIWVNVSYPRTKDWALPLEEINTEYLRANVEAHLNSYIWLSRKAALAMKESKTKGTIINFGSIYGIQANDLSIYEGTSMVKGEMIYSSVKAGIVNLTRCLASYFGHYGIRANSICPGGIFDNQNEVFVRNYSRRVPLQRMGNPEDVASVVLFLASEASAYISGATIMVDGGWTII